ncbi:RNA polymerase sigma factor (sigma-70 family) [Streptomyces sp. SAI-135]|uniref:sigma-70 family RNA polymerase sigma factor n=1 Tax=unclassified Streptomyces TaxID=2593676 RepID=UPI002474CF1A|nr:MULTISPECIES: sigma-70 family RNA polymerase sigma factor [unclassified Streptomyces]MDH6518795.1 RNA polymerase sigma factor (sigma-70 family) [Streptomyces sp. SAI-090]MDH6617111.1 RNA polymerase sigma factor (sigma-70 family) [Streptomyces sp. SAI-135]
MTDRPARVPARTSSAATAATAAYVRVYEEEQPRLVAYARSLTRNSWAAEDLVAEAHFRVWRRLSAGHEIDNVPAYLRTTVRHLASSVASATHETPRDPQVPEQATAGHVADPAEQVSATDLLVRVLGELPERWVRALWLADAEGQPLETVGRQIGAKQGATAVLLHRAREGMRQAFLRSQTEPPEDPACEVHWVRMPAYVRGNATPRQSERLLAHVDTCDGCRGRLAVLIRANDRLPALVGPALLVFAVGGGTGKFLASLTASSVGSASVTGQGLLRTVRAAGPRTKAALASGTAAATAAVVAVLALGMNDSPATLTSPGRTPVAQAPVAGPSAGAVGEGEGPGGALPVEVDRGRDRERDRERNRDRTRGDAVGVVVTGEFGGGSGSVEEGGVVGAPEAPDPGPGPVQPEPAVPEPVVPDPEPGPADPAPGGEEPEPPAEPTPAPPKEHQPEPKPGPEKPEPGTPGDGTPVPQPPGPPQPPETPDPQPDPTPPPTGDDCGRGPSPEHPAHGHGHGHGPRNFRHLQGS